MNAQRTIVLEALILCLALAIPGVANGDSTHAPEVTRLAQGNDDAVAVLSIELIDVAAELRVRLLTGMHEGMSQMGVSAVTAERVDSALREQPDLAGCVTPACRGRLGMRVGAARFVTLRVEATGTNYKIAVALYTRDSEEPVRSLSDRCDVCRHEDVVRSVQRTTRRIVGPPPEMDVQITSAPSGATVSVDGQEIGPTPYTGKLVAGAHTLTATLTEHETAETQIDVKEEADGPQVFHVSLTTGTVKIVESTPRPYRYFKWAGVVATAGIVGAGAGWLIVDGKGTCSDRPVCPEVYDTRTQGYIALGAGAAVGVFTVWMFLRDRSDAQKSLDDIALVPMPGGAFARVGWRF